MTVSVYPLIALLSGNITNPISQAEEIDFTPTIIGKYRNNRYCIEVDSGKLSVRFTKGIGIHMFPDKPDAPCLEQSACETQGGE